MFIMWGLEGLQLKGWRAWLGGLIMGRLKYGEEELRCCYDTSLG